MFAEPLVITALTFGTRGDFITPRMEEYRLTGARVGLLNSRNSFPGIHSSDGYSRSTS